MLYHFSFPFPKFHRVFLLLQVFSMIMFVFMYMLIFWMYLCLEILLIFSKCLLETYISIEKYIGSNTYWCRHFVDKSSILKSKLAAFILVYLFCSQYSLLIIVTYGCLDFTIEIPFHLALGLGLSRDIFGTVPSVFLMCSQGSD
jgi:hypothetical protein